MKGKFEVRGMTCAACQAHVQKAVEKVKGVSFVNVNLLKNNMTVEYDEKICSEEEILRAVAEGGYSAFPASSEKGTASKGVGLQREKDTSLRDLIISALLLLVVMYFSMGNMMWGWPAPAVFDHHKNPMGFALLQFILVLPILYLYRGYFIRGFQRLFHKSANMDSLIAMGAAASLLYGIFALFMIAYGQAMIVHITSGEMAGDAEHYREIVTTYHDSLYFESAGMILTLVSLGKYLEGLSKKRTTDAIAKLMNLAPKRAMLLVDGEEREIGAEEVKVGDLLVVRKGGAIPVDGVIEEGNCSVDQSNITGESLPVSKKEGEEVYSSTIVTAGFVKIRATKVGEDTSIAAIIRLVEEASNSKAPISRLADKISGVFVPVVFGIALLTLVANLLAGLFFSHLEVAKAVEIALRFAISVVVIACPCALGLATPVAIMVGTGKGAENGLLIRNAEILEKAHDIKTVVLDKTGTITEGKPRVTDFIPFGEDCLAQIAAIEARSEHPLAQAIAEYAANRGVASLEVTDFIQQDGLGIGGRVDGAAYFIGNRRMCAERGIGDEEVFRQAEAFSAQGKTPLFVLREEKLAALLAVKDEVKPTSRRAIEKMKSRGMRVVMLTGDNRATAEAIAREIGVDEVISDVFPADKQKVVESLKTDGKHLVAMVGDGVNDAPALMSADIGIAIGGGSDVAVESGDVVLLRKDLTDVVKAVDLSKRVLNTIKLGLFWAFFYNIVCVIIATGVFYYPFGFSINPMIGSIAMSVSSLSVVLNALTINLFRTEKKKDGKEIVLKVKGMMCGHCVRRVEEACRSAEGVSEAKADLKKKRVVIKGDRADIRQVIEKIKEAGYEVKK